MTVFGGQALVDRAHDLGLAVLLDIVHSHISSNANDGLSGFVTSPLSPSQPPAWSLMLPVPVPNSLQCWSSDVVLRDQELACMPSQFDLNRFGMERTAFGEADYVGRLHKLCGH